MCMGCEHKNPEIRAQYHPHFNFGLQSFVSKHRVHCEIADKECPCLTQIIYWPDGEWVNKEDFNYEQDYAHKSDDYATLTTYDSSEEFVEFAIKAMLAAPFLKEEDLGTEDDGTNMPDEASVTLHLMRMMDAEEEHY